MHCYADWYYFIHLGRCDKLRNYHKCSDSTLNVIDSPIFKNHEVDYNINKNKTSTLNKNEESLSPEEHPSTPFDFHYKTTDNPNKSFEDFFIDNLAFSMSLEAYPTFPYPVDIFGDLSMVFKGCMSKLYNKIFNILNSLDEQISKDKYFEIYHLADAYF